MCKKVLQVEKGETYYSCHWKNLCNTRLLNHVNNKASIKIWDMLALNSGFLSKKESIKRNHDFSHFLLCKEAIFKNCLCKPFGS